MNKFNHCIRLRHDLREPTHRSTGKRGRVLLFLARPPISMISGNLPLLTARFHLIAGNCASVLKVEGVGVAADSVRIIRN